MPTVMIVDDDRTTVGLLKTLLQLDGFEVIVAPDSKTALGQAHALHPDAFLIDFHLMDRDGTDLVKELRAAEAFGDTPIIMASGAERKVEALDAGADFFLGKPFDPVELVDILNELLGD